MTINKLNLPAKANAVQSKINEIIDNFPTNVVLVAEYGVTSYSAILSEYNAGKLIFLKSDFLIVGTGEQGTYLIPLEKYDEKTNSTAEFVFSVINNSTQKKYIINSSNTWSMDTLVFANATLSNVSSISNNSAVQTALDGKVSKSGDTMTGNLIISKNTTAKIEFTNTSFDATSTTAPASSLYAGAIDISGLDNYHIGHFRTRHSAANNFQSQMGVRRSINNTDYEANINVGIDTNGTSFCTFPDTTCVDGQWTKTYQDIISSDTSVNGSTNLTKRVAVPNDGHVYEAMIITRATTTSTSGQILRVAVGTNQLGQDVMVCGLRTRTNNTMEVQATNIVPIKGVATNSTNLTIVRGSGINGNINVMRLIAYRRVGTNS